MTKCSNLRQQIMDDVQRRYGEYLDKDKVSCITSKIAAAENKYPAKTTLASAIFYIKVDTQITSEGGKHFSGNAGGLSSPGGGVLFGDLYTDDLDDLYTNTVSFQITMTPVFC
ncbi:TPA: VapA/VapB family virulence-associated protein, partial [Escherichia coli]